MIASSSLRPWQNSVLAVTVLLCFACRQQYDTPAAKIQHIYDTTASSLDHTSMFLADSLHNLRHYDSANNYFAKAHEELLQQNSMSLAITNLSKWGFNLIEMGALDSAFSIMAISLELASQHLAENDPEWAGIRLNQGIYTSQTGNSDSALTYLNQALAIDQAVYKERATRFRAHILHRIGDIYRYVSPDYRQAERFYQQALAIREQVLPGDHYDLLVSYYALASIYRIFDDHRRAEIFGENALQIAQNLKGDNTQALSFCHNLVGNILHEKAKLEADTSDYLQAIQHYRLAIELMEDRGDPALGYYYNNLGETYQKLVELSIPQPEYYQQRALSYYHRSLRMKRPLGNPLEIADSYLTLGWGHKMAQDYDSANYYYSRCLGIRKKQLPSGSPNIAEVHLELGRMYEDQDLLEPGIMHYRKAIEVLQLEDSAALDLASANSEILFRSLIDCARLLTKRFHLNDDLEDLKQALSLYNRADRINNEHRNVNIYDEAKLYFQNYYSADFERAMEACYQLHSKTGDSKYLDNAFRFMEKDKYMLLFESLTKSSLVSEIGVPDSVLRLERQLTSSMAELRLKQQGLVESAIAEKEELNKKILEVNRDLERLKNHINRLYPGYYQIQYDSLANSIYSFQATLGQDELLMEYYWGQEAVYALGLSMDEMRLIKIPIDNRIREHINTYLEVLREGKGVSEKLREFPNYVESSFQLYKIFIEPLISGTNGQNLIIVPDGKLNYLPIEPLLTEVVSEKKPDYRNLPYLLTKYRVRYAYNTSLLWRNKKINRQSPSILALNHSELRGSSEEIKALESTISTTVLSGSKASEHNFKRRAKEFDILHLALHGEGGGQDSQGSKLLFKENQGSPEDGELNSYELYNLTLKADLAVLSACETGIGKEVAGEGVYSMARAFSYAGCPSVIMSLWKIDDRQSAHIFKNFYQHIKKGMGSSHALHQAKLQFLQSQDEITAHPSAWAALVSIGDSQWPPSTSVGGSNYLWLIGIAGLLSLAIVYWKMRYYRNQHSSK